MFVKRLALVMILLLCGSSACAEITLKKGFFSGWKYSIDGQTFTKVGYTGSRLYDEMEGHQEAQARLLQYRSAKSWALVSGIPGGILLGWPLGAYAGSGGEWEDSYTTMIIVGGSLAVVSMILEATATRHLKEAVALYNGDERKLGLLLGFKSLPADRSPSPLLGLKLEF